MHIYVYTVYCSMKIIYLFHICVVPVFMFSIIRNVLRDHETSTICIRIYIYTLIHLYLSIRVVNVNDNYFFGSHL